MYGWRLNPTKEENVCVCVCVCVCLCVCVCVFVCEREREREICFGISLSIFDSQKVYQISHAATV